MGYKRISPIPVAEGGSGGSSLTAYAVVCGGTTSTSALQSIASVGTSGQVLTSNGASALPTFQTAASGGITTLDGDTGAATGSTVTLHGGNNITTSATSATVTLNVSGTTNNAVQVGNSGGSLTSLSVGTNGQLLIGTTTANPSWVTPTAGNGLAVTTNATTLSYGISAPVSIANGGTNATSMTNTDGVVYYSGTALTTTTVGTSGQVLTSNGTGNAPTFKTPSAGSITITGDSGGALTGSSFTFTGGTTGLTFSGATTTETLTGTLGVANGGTGDTSLTAYSVLCGGTTSTGAVQSVASVGSSGQVLTSNGAAALPTFQAPAAHVSILGTTSLVFSTLGGKRWFTPYCTTNSSVQATQEFVMPCAGTISNLFVNVTTNANTAAGTVTVNRNGVNTSIVATITASATGVFSDTTHSQAFSQGDTLQFESSTPTVGGATGVVSVQFSA